MYHDSLSNTLRTNNFNCFHTSAGFATLPPDCVTHFCSNQFLLTDPFGARLSTTGYTVQLLYLTITRLYISIPYYLNWQDVLALKYTMFTYSYL